MKHAMETILLIISAVLCALLLSKILYNLRSTLSWRVNCWFCNNNFWVKFIERNCWICPKCEQYNGFTKDGDYNKKLQVSEDIDDKNIKVFQRSPSKNGLCKMCNINQQLKVTQLANFIPMNEKKFDEEIEIYRVQLEKAYKLCSPCKKVVQTKLHKEKEKLLEVKLLETRTPERKDNIKNQKQNQIFSSLINSTSVFIAGILIILLSIECYDNAIKQKNLFRTIENIKEIFNSLTYRILSIVKMKMLMTFPSFKYLDVNEKLDLDRFINFNSVYNDIAQQALGGFVCILQIVGHISNTKKGYSIVIDLLWTIFVAITILHKYVIVDKLVISLIKFSSIFAIMLIYKSNKRNTIKNVTRRHATPKNLTKPNSKSTFNRYIDEEDSLSLDTDDDVSLSKFGLHNFTDSSHENASSLNNSITGGRSFTPRSNSLWTKPKHKPLFSVNSMSHSPNNSVLHKPSFKKYQKLGDDSDSDLDESISSLCISSPKKKSSKMNPVFELRKFTASPNFIAPSPMNRARPLISPSKLSHSTSWVAGGYWGTEGERQIFNVNGSRSSSQSSGFESQASSNQRNLFSQPPSREESVCREPDKTLIVLDRFQPFNMNGYNNFHNPSSFTPVSSPVFPQMQYNGHVQIPQPRFAEQKYVTQSVFSQQQHVHNIFKAPGGSRLIKLPQDNTFMSH